MKSCKQIFQVATVFVGTIVGAGLASGQEITQFFSTYGYVSFLGLIICGVLYVLFTNIISSVSLEYNLNSYSDFINLVSPNFLGKITDYLTSFFLISGSAVILAGSGSLLYQYFGIPKYIGMLIMLLVSVFTLLNDTKGLIAINSFIVPSLVVVIATVFFLYCINGGKCIDMSYLKGVPIYKNLIVDNQWIFSTIIYAGFNLLFSSGVLVPITKEIKSKRIMLIGLIVGSLTLTFIAFLINSLLLVNTPEIFKYEIPLLFVSSKFSKLIQVLLLIIIWCEMFSTEVSDIYSVSKTLEEKYAIPYKRGIILTIVVAIPISQIGFKKLITFLYPGFGIISLIFLVQCVLFYLKMKKR